ncbi:hypothetical protein OAV62_01605 [bacterium]|nr:hypothetical protein [bacterium]
MPFAMNIPGSRRRPAQSSSIHQQLYVPHPQNPSFVRVPSHQVGEKGDVGLPGEKGEKGEDSKRRSYGFSINCSYNSELETQPSFLVGAILENFDILESIQFVVKGKGTICLSSSCPEKDTVEIVTTETVITVEKTEFASLLSGGIEPMSIHCSPGEDDFSILLVQVMFH